MWCGQQQQTYGLLTDGLSALHTCAGPGATGPEDALGGGALQGICVCMKLFRT